MSAPSTAGATRARPGGRTRARELGVDVARGAAVISMFVAHFAPAAGPGGVLDLSEYLTAPLFALLIGWGAQLGRGREREVWSVVVRAGVLVLVGLLLERAGAQIVVVLVWLGVLTLLAVVLVRLPSVLLVVVGGAVFVAAPRALEWAREWVLERIMAGQVTDGLLAETLELTIAGPFYRLSGMVPLACLGILLARHAGRVVTLGTLVASAAGSLALAGAQAAGSIDMAPYTGTQLVMVFEVCLVVAVVQLCRTVAPFLGGFGRLTATVGAMTLSLYVAQILVAAWYVADRPLDFRDDSWLVLAAMVVGSYALAAAWPRVVRRAPWSRGPLEGPVRAVVDLPLPRRSPR